MAAQARRLIVAAAGVLLAAALLASPAANGAGLSLDSFPEHWQKIGRVTVETGTDSVTIANGYVGDPTPLGDCAMSFRARARAAD